MNKLSVGNACRSSERTVWLARGWSLTELSYWSSDLGVLWRMPDDCGLEKLDEHIVVSTVHR